MKIPEQVLLDKMHSTARGAQENLNNLWFNQKKIYLYNIKLTFNNIIEKIL